MLMMPRKIVALFNRPQRVGVFSGKAADPLAAASI